MDFLNLQTCPYTDIQKEKGQFPGHVEKGEDDYTTALRETEEEAGLQVEKHYTVDKDFKRELNYVANNKPKVVVYWLAKLNEEFDDLNDPVKMSHEHKDYKWLPLAKAISIGGYKDMEMLFRECNTYLEKKYSK